MKVAGLGVVAALTGLTPGQTVVLPPGDHDTITIKNEQYEPPVTIDARAARVNGVRIYGSSGIVWRGGTIVAPQGDTRPGGIDVHGGFIRDSRNIAFEGVTFTASTRGLVFLDTQRITLRGNHFTGLRVDGVNIAGGSDVLVENNRFDTFHPVKSTGTYGQPDFVDGDHPDAVQLWNTDNNPHGDNIVIRRNIVDGDMQGLTFFGPAKQGYSRVVVADNDVRVTYPSAVAVKDCTGCTVTGNRAASAPGAKYRANVRIDNSTGRLCGNAVPEVRAAIAGKPC